MWYSYFSRRASYPQAFRALMRRGAINVSIIVWALPVFATLFTLGDVVMPVIVGGAGVYAIVYAVVLYRRRAPVQKICFAALAGAIVVGSFIERVPLDFVSLGIAAVLMFNALTLDKKRVVDASGAVDEMRDARVGGARPSTLLGVVRRAHDDSA